MVEVTKKEREGRAAPRATTRLPRRTMLLHCPVARDEGDAPNDGAPNLLCVPLVSAHEEALVVFSSGEVARNVLPSGVYPGGCDSRVCSGGELVSLLFGPYKDVDWVLFDPLPGQDPDEATEANLVSRERFVDYLLGRSVPEPLG